MNLFCWTNFIAPFPCSNPSSPLDWSQLPPTYTQKHTHTHTHTQCSSIMISMFTWRHGKSWVQQLLAVNSSHQQQLFQLQSSLTHSLTRIRNGIGQTTTYHECRASLLLSSLSSRFLSNCFVGVWSTNLPHPPTYLVNFFQPMGVSEFGHQTQIFLGQFCDVGKVLMIHRNI